MIFFNITLNPEYNADPFRVLTPYVDFVEEFRLINSLQIKLCRLGYQSTIIEQKMPLNEKMKFVSGLDKKRDMVITFCLGDTNDNYSGRIGWYVKSSNGRILGKIMEEQLTHSSRAIVHNPNWWKNNPRNRSYLNFLKKSPECSVVVFLAKQKHLYDLSQDYLEYVATTTIHSIHRYKNLR